MNPLPAQHINLQCLRPRNVALRPAAISLLVLLWSVPCLADTYWIPTVRDDGKFAYDVEVPEFFVPLVLTRTARGGGAVTTKKINGQEYTFIIQALAWDTSDAHPSGTQQILILQQREAGMWQHLPEFEDHAEFTTALEALGAGEKWSFLEFLWVLRTTDDSNPNLVVDPAVIDPYSPRVPTMALRELAKRTRAGRFYSDVEIPINIAAFRRNMLAIGNLARRDPEFRTKHGETVAIDLTANTTRFNGQDAQIYRNNSTAPYFVDLTLNPKLCEAAQFQAEQQAMNKQAGHEGPADFNGADMRDFNDRVRHFGYSLVTAGEAAGGWDATAFPRKWLVSDTHFGPWFNVTADVREMGLGAAQADDGTWYFAAIAGVATKGRLSNRLVGGDKVLRDNGDRLRNRLIWEASGSSNNQLWRLEAAGANTYWIVNVKTGKVLAANNSAEPRASGRGAGNQIWELRRDASGQYTFMNPFSAQRLAAAIASDSTATMYTVEPNDRAGQWTFEIVHP